MLSVGADRGECRRTKEQSERFRVSGFRISGEGQVTKQRIGWREVAVTLPISVFVSEIGAVESVERYWTKVQYTSTTVPVYCPIKVF